jgi:hypothetical protein
MQMLNTLLGTSWKTSLISYAIAAAMAALQVASTGQFELTTILQAAGIAAFGRAAKDFDVTGAK